ncbi:glycosyltransferase family 4 protein [Flavobacterium sp. CAN_S2]|uniref:glycosyltransferase family 4 protein n=1 Tax=Flavobacterium sp. CAN_S2 TaxID=2787726 RepID=UPI0018CBEE70
MKIVFSTDQIYLHGGIEKVMATKANYFAEELGYEVVIVTCEQRGKKPCYAFSEKIQFLDLEINYQRNKSYFSIHNLLKIPLHLCKLNSTLQQLEPDFVIVCNFGFDYYGMPFLHSKSKKIKEFHSSRYLDAQNRLENKSVLQQIKYRFNDWIEKQYDSIVVLNTDEAAYYNTENIVVIPNSIVVPEEQALLDRKAVVAAGRIAPVKGFDKLIEAWGIVHDTEPEWELHIYGEDYLETQQFLEKLIQEKKLGNTVFFKGISSNMTKTFCQYSLYAMSSVTECFPMVLLEALSVGLPVVSFDCPNGPRNIISNEEDGFLADNQNSFALGQKILFLIQDEAKRKKYGLQAKLNSKNFSDKMVMKNWITLFNSMHV